MKKYFSEIAYLLDKNVNKIPSLILLFIVLSMLDFIGLALVGTYVSLIVSPELASGTYLFNDIFKWFVGDGNFNISAIGVFLLIIFLVKSVVAIIVNYIIIRFSQKQELELRSYLMRSYQSLPYSEYVKRNSSEYVYSIQQLTATFSGSLKSLLRGSSDLTISVVIFILLATSNIYMLFTLTLVLGATVYLYDYITRKPLISFGEKINLASTSMVKGIHEGIEGLKEIRILGCENFFYRKVRKEAAEAVHYHGFQQMLALLPRYLFELLLVSLVVFFVFLILSSNQDIGTWAPVLGVFGVAAIRLIPIVNSLANTFSTVRFSMNSIEILYKDVILLRNTKFKTHENVVNTTKSKEIFKELVLDNVSFSYSEKSKTILDNVSLSIKAGESIGVVGVSGSGKTTLIDVLLGLIEPQNGRVLFNGTSLGLDEDKWRSQVAYLPQQVFLVDDTLRNNVAIGISKSEINEVLVLEALQKAKLIELVNELPNGINTFIGERGIRLSGGQRQRVALARAFYYKRNVLVLDESTSSLDNETESEIIEEIQRLKGDVTMIIIAHRLSTICHCDYIFQLENGRITKIEKDCV